MFFVCLLFLTFLLIFIFLFFKNPAIHGADGFFQKRKNPIRHTTTVYFIYERGMSHLAMAGFFYTYSD